MTIVGVDLSGPANSKDTVLSWFTESDRKMMFGDWSEDLDDAQLLQALDELRSLDPNVVVGIDAPLSYRLGGKSREADKTLRMLVQKKGLHAGSVMAPTAPRMAYLTLRGISVARCFAARQVEIVEVHPGATFALHGAPAESVRGFRDEVAHRDRLLAWLAANGVKDIDPDVSNSSHAVAACGAAFAAWNWSRGTHVWLCKANPPHHPFDFSC